jgi:hypothetical protein
LVKLNKEVMKMKYSRQDLLEGRVTHDEYYRQFAKEHHIAITGITLFGVRDMEHLRQLIKADPNLNNIPLKYFDSMTNSYNMYNPHDRMTLAEGASVYKTLLKDLATQSAIKWREMPSVTTGGKPTFFVADTPWGKRWVAWNRVERKWLVTGEQEAPRGESPVYGKFNTAEEGKRFVEEGKATKEFLNTPIKKRLAKPTRDDVEIHKWFERDRQHIEVRDKKTQETVAEWWDEAVSEMVESGFFYAPGIGGRIPSEQRKLDESVLKYLEDTGVLDSGKKAAWCPVCAGDLDAQGKCPKGHFGELHVQPKSGKKGGNGTVKAIAANKRMVDLVEASEHLAYAYQLAIMGYGADAFEHVEIALFKLSELGINPGDEDFEPLMKPLKELQRGMPALKIASHVSDAQEELKRLAPLLAKGG